jgi:hypothetical protein
MPGDAHERRRTGSTSSIVGGGWRRQASAPDRQILIREPLGVSRAIVSAGALEQLAQTFERAPGLTFGHSAHERAGGECPHRPERVAKLIAIIEVRAISLGVHRVLGVSA